MKIAYIEDDTDSLFLFSKKFKSDGIQCDGFENAEEALTQTEAGSYDLLICDIRLPGISGVEFLSRLRQKQIYTPCILITAFNNLSLTKQALNANASYLLEKPFTYKQLREVMDKTFQSSPSLQYWVDRGLERLKLTDRENEVMRLVLKGLSNQEIAKMTSLSEKTVKQYVSQVFEKAGVSSRGEFFSYIFPV